MPYLFKAELEMNVKIILNNENSYFLNIGCT